MKELSLIIPCYNESSPLRDTFFQLQKVLSSETIKKKYSSKMIFVNDGSTDNTLEIIQEIANENSNVKFISFSRNFGKEAAMLAGLKYSNGDITIIIDADLQHPPHLILDMIKYYEEGYDQVIAKRSRRGENIARKWTTRFYYQIINKLIDVELVDGIGDFRLLSRDAVDSLLAMPEYNRFSKGLFSWIGFKKKIIDYENQERVSGESKWGFSSLLNYAIDGMTSFNSKPLRLLIYLGVIITILNLIYIGYTFFNILAFGIDTPGYFTLISSILLLGGIQLISIGILGEYVGRIFYEVKQRPYYIIKDTNIKSESIQLREKNER
ncbi:glycosyltransferase family 2 protein [Virgibacillus halodenitrificans]|uniref:glycosyltransferase family 2 protein n=1 Tax=Virgibacillus halodenitrificans TaxID=1482 RepID=UPI002DC0530D|nr:glycosyltransferase family 2 protein [Virgibacillus halodenitrificans]MEC2158533.1 glycosyltransferase family 2 protein [Virgibacillus halodenitrificans]